MLAFWVARTPAQDQRVLWNEPQKPFKVFGNVYWVGSRGLGSILITSTSGHILIDGALPESVAQIREHIRELGFSVADIKLILNSHTHFDHAGGIGELHRLSGARVAASASSATVLKRGTAGPDDPQYGLLPPVESVAKVRVVRDGETLNVGELAITAHMTPGHTSGSTTWSWRSCESARCADIVYADSLTAVSAETFKYTRSPLLRGFEQSFTTLEGLPCDILLTPHPDASRMFEKLAARNAGNPDAFIDAGGCKAYVAAARANVARRVANEQVK
jgi:metallo-beta-lactamase class B